MQPTRFSTELDTSFPKDNEWGLSHVGYAIRCKTHVAIFLSTYFCSTIWRPWYHPIPRLGAPHPTSTTSACPFSALATTPVLEKALMLLVADRAGRETKADERPARKKAAVAKVMMRRWWWFLLCECTEFDLIEVVKGLKDMVKLQFCWVGEVCATRFDFVSSVFMKLLACCWQINLEMGQGRKKPSNFPNFIVDAFSLL